jgi:hypothetical protein
VSARIGVQALLLAFALAGGAPALAQPRPAPASPAATPREAAAIDLTGQWVAIVNEDWRWRMVTPPKGDYASVPLNAEGRRVADEWTPDKDGACEAYGAAAIMRMPTRLRVRWRGDDVLEIETDAGRQTRSLRFGAVDTSAPRSLQGQSEAKWVPTLRRAGGPGLVGTAASEGGSGGYLEVKTTRLTPGWLRRNGVPYSEDAVVTEYFARFPAPNGDEWLMVTTVVDDPRFLTQRFITSSHFRREREGGRWNPQPCRGSS